MKALMMLLTIFFMLIFTSCGDALPDNSAQSLGAPDYSFTITNPSNSITTTPITPSYKPTSEHEKIDENEIVYIESDQFNPIYYVEVKENTQDGQCDAQILGAYYERSFISWMNIALGEGNLHPFDYLDKYQEDYNYACDIHSILATIGQPIRVCGMDGTIIYTTVNKNPEIYPDEGGLFFYTTLDMVDDNVDLPIGDYIAIGGEWNPMPRHFKCIDSLGTIEVDLDGNGQNDYLRIGTYTDMAYNGDNNAFQEIEYLNFSIELNGIPHEITDMVPETFSPCNDDPHLYARFFPIDVNGDGVYEVFLLIQTIESYNVHMYSLDDEISSAKLVHSVAP